MPEALLRDEPDPDFYGEWIDSFYARDILELFAIRQRTGFLSLLRLLLRQSGGMVDYTQLARLSGLSRPTVMAHVEALTVAHAICLVTPFYGGGRREITKRPKAYAFDTGFVAHTRGWTSLRQDDRGGLWEHLVLDVLRSRIPASRLYYWRDKSGREIDFVFSRDKATQDAIECKINPDAFDPRNLQVFRSHYPWGENHVVSPAVKTPYSRRVGGHEVNFCGTGQLPGW